MVERPLCKRIVVGSSPIGGSVKYSNILKDNEMLTFNEYNQQLQKHIGTMTKNGLPMFVVNTDKDKMWETYLDSFPEGTNEIFRTRREYDCSCCRNFIKNFGNAVVVLPNSAFVTIWDFLVDDDKFQAVNNVMSKFIRQHSIDNVFVATQRIYGTYLSREIIDDKIVEWDHFSVNLPLNIATVGTDMVATLQGKYVESATMLKRALTEIRPDAISAVVDLAGQGLYRGEEFLPLVLKFQKLQTDYMNIDENRRNNFVWSQSLLSDALCRIRNSAIGTLLVDISNEEDIEAAVVSFEKKVAPENYKRSTPVYTEKMKEDAKKKLIEMGLLDSIPRRFATLSDVSVRDVLWVNRTVVPKMKDPIFDTLKPQSKPVKSDHFRNVSDWNISEFMEMLPTITKMRILFDPTLAKNLVSLTTAIEEDAKPLFKWGNNTAWTYNGNMTDSAMKQAVAAKGGKIDGVLRFSISWTHGDDLDAHCVEPPKSTHIYFGNKQSSSSLGQLDVDIMSPVKNVLSVENITWALQNRMHDGVYKFYVHNYSKRNSKDGFKAEIQFDGSLYQFDYTQELRQDEKVDVAIVTLDDGQFTIKTLLPAVTTSQKAWGLDSGQFYDVNLVTLSPNFWNGNTIGNKHYMFMVNEAVNADRPNGFFNEYLLPELTPHRKVFEALSNSMRVEHSDNQLSGFGFSSTQKAEFVLEITSDSAKRIVKVTV